MLIICYVYIPLVEGHSDLVTIYFYMIKSLEKTLCLKIFISNPIKVAKILTTVSKIPLSITMQILLGKISV